MRITWPASSTVPSFCVNRIADNLPQHEPIGIAIKSNDAQFLNLVQNYVDAYAKSGMLSKLRKKWLEEKDWIAALP